MRTGSVFAAVLVALQGQACATDAESSRYDSQLEVLAARIEAVPANWALREAVDRRIPEIDAATGPGISARLDALAITPMRVPGLYYRSNPASGAGLAAAEVWLDRPVALIPTNEIGSVDENAARIAAAVRDATGRSGRVALISASKGSADVRRAIESFPDVGERIAIWIDLVGLLEGTPLMNPQGLGRRATAAWLPDDTADSMSVDSIRARPPVNFPASVAAVHIAAFPRAHEISPHAREAFRLLRPRGLNDGYVMLESYLRAPGRVLVLRGTDHYLRTVDLAPALAATLLTLLDGLEAL